MRLLSFLLGVALFVVAGFTQNALMGIGSIILAIIAMLWPAASSHPNVELHQQFWQMAAPEELRAVPLPTQRSQDVPQLPEITTSNVKSQDLVANRSILG